MLVIPVVIDRVHYLSFCMYVNVKQVFRLDKLHSPGTLIKGFVG